MAGRARWCVIHLNTTEIINNNFFEQTSAKIKSSCPRIQSDKFDEIPFKSSCHLYKNVMNKQQWNMRPLAATVSAGTWQRAFHTCPTYKGTSTFLQNHHRFNTLSQTAVPWQTGCWLRCRPPCFLWKGQSVCLVVSWTRASVCSRSGHCIQTWRGSAAWTNLEQRG